MENYSFGHSGNFMLGYRLTLPERYSLGEDDYDELNALWAKALRDLPDGSVFFKQDIFTEDKFDTSKFPEKNFIQKSTKDYYNGMDFLNHVTNIFFIKKNEDINFSKLKNPFRPAVKKEFQEFDEKINSFIPAVNECISYLRNVRLKNNNRIVIEPLEKDYLNKYYELIFSGLNTNYKTEIKKEWSHIRIGNQYGSLLRFPHEQNFPEKFKTCIKDGEKTKDNYTFFKNYGDNFSFDLPFTHIYNQIAFIDKKDVHLNKLKKTNNQFRDYRRFDPGNQHWFDKTSEMILDLTENQSHTRLIRGYNSVIIFGKDEEELERRMNTTSERFKELDIIAERPYGDNLLAQYEFSYPLNASMFLDEHVYVATTEVFSSFLLNTGRYKNDSVGVLYNSRLDNTPVIVDLWDSAKKYMDSRSGVIITKTGGGKSFNTNHISAFALANNYRNVIIDLGGSYQKLAAIFPNDVAYISYNEGDNLGINPFELVDGEQVSADKIEELLDFIEVHFKRVDNRMNQQEKASLRRILDHYYDNFSTGHSLPHFVKNFIKYRKDLLPLLDIKKEFFDDDEFVLMMSEFVDNGLYSFLYNSETGLSYGAELYNKKLVVFELDKIRDNQLLVTLMLKVINTTIKRVIWRDKSTRGYVFLEEFAELLKWEGMLRQAEWLFQAIRKQEGALFLVLQTINQLPKDNPASLSIIDNCEVMFVLSGANYKAIQERFGLSTHALYQMESLENKYSDPVHPHSEVFIKRGKQFGVYRLEVPRKVFWAYQTEGLLNSVLMKIYNSDPDMTMEQAIDIIMEKEKIVIEWADVVKQENEDESKVGDYLITQFVEKTFKITA
ncbi:DUF87 domain-containing protein [Elizabethkingia meningoseptica]|uniref:VirB4 family type IV secretion system protein n=1 Tax=Elizabethkingia meningoseptica TaxID=238 RepID=UPI0023B15164|nr:DUF87 domain-containing protein [Elizabethkingia meningoseptica]MDE5510645.1 DUF87 domain-containing protein [Elizabethkingia meningoseptica]